MAEHMATRPLKLGGVDYKRGDLIPRAALDLLPSRRLKELVDQRRLTEHRPRVGRPPKEG